MPGPPGRTKSRRHQACIACSKVHIKCDSTRPCAQCVLRNLGDTCEDPERKSSCTMCRSLRAKCNKERPCGRCIEMRLVSACSSVTDMMALRRRGSARASLLDLAPAQVAHDGASAARAATAVHVDSYAGALGGWRREPSARDTTDTAGSVPTSAPDSPGVMGALLERRLPRRDVPALASFPQSTASVEPDPRHAYNGDGANSEIDDSAASTLSIGGRGARDAPEGCSSADQRL